MQALGLKKVFLFYASLTAVALVVMWMRDGLTSLAPGLAINGWLQALGAGVGTGLAMVGASRLASSHLRWAARLAEEFRHLIGPLGARRALAVALLSGIGEEVLFRGVLQPAIGLWLAAAVFAALHIGPSLRFLPWTAMAFVAGAAFGGLFLWTGNLVAPIVAHATVNFLNLRYLAKSDRGDEVHLGPAGGEGLVSL